MIDLNATNSEDINPGNDALAVGADQTGTEAGADNNADNDEFADLFDDDVSGDDETPEDKDPEVDAEDDDSILDELADNNSETDGAEPKPEPKPEKPAAAETEKPAVPVNAAPEFPPDVIPGTIEYIDRIDREARELVKKQLGLTDENFDPEFDTKHRFALERATRQLDVKAEKFYEDKKQEIKQAEEANKALVSADNQIDSILGGPELGKVFVETVNKLPYGKVLEMKQKAEAGDYSSFINLATKIAQAKGKVKAINYRPAAPSRPVARPQQHRTEIADGNDDDGVAALLGL